MASSPVKLAVPSPCSQSWQAMTSTKQGRFCTHCQKTVVNFAAMTDAQVLAFLGSSPADSGCGRFRTDQLNRVLTPAAAGKPGRWQWLGVLLSGWLSSQVVQAQTIKEPNGIVAMHTPATSSPDSITTELAKQSALITIEGRVISAKERFPIPGASIFVLNTDYKASTDSAGLFRLTIPSPSPDSTVQLSVSYIFYATQRLTLKSAAVAEPVLVELQEDTAALNEQFVVGYVIQKPTLWRRIRNRFRR